MQPPPAVPAARPRKPGPRLLTSLIVMGGGIVLGIIAVVAIVIPLASSFTSPEYPVPGEVHQTLHHDRYTVYQYTGTRSVFGGGSNVGVIRIPAESVTVTAPDGSNVPVAISTSDAQLTRGTSVFQAALVFDAPISGDYTLEFNNPTPNRVIVARSIADELRGVVAWFGVGALGGLLLILGLVMLIVGATRRGRAKRAMYAGWGAPPQWGPPPQQWGPPQQQWGPPQQQWGAPPPPGNPPPPQWPPPPEDPAPPTG